MWEIRGITLHSLRRASSAGILLALAFTVGYMLLPTVGDPRHPSLRGGGCGPHVVGRPEERFFRTHILATFSLRTAAAAEGKNVSMVGLWHTRFLAGGKVYDEGYDVWNSDGTEILNDIAPPQPANGAGTICLGAYKKVGPRTYKLRHPFWIFDANAKLAGTGVIQEQVTVAENGNNYSGSFKYITYDLKGTMTDQVSGDIKAERITVD